MARGVLAGEVGPVRDIVLLNAAAGLAAFALAQDPDLQREPMIGRLAVELERAAETVDSGAAAAKLEEWAAATRR